MKSKANRLVSIVRRLKTCFASIPKRIRLAIKCMVGCAVLLAGYLLILNISGNFHTVVPNEVYRSAQLESDDIIRLKEQYHIRTILNLRGENKGHEWYDKEIEASKEAGVEHLDFRMSAARGLSKEEALKLIEVMRNAPKPLLIHCQAGADRTGLASAFYIAAIKHGSEWAAERQMWIIYGHIPFWFSKAVEMNRTFERLEPYLGFTNS